ncbi:hypothetical protein C8R45DRAFT_817585, partial [Mycena sanguinolenta]
MTDVTEFNRAWDKIQETAPLSFINYLNEYWMKPEVVRMWSAIYRQNRTIFEMCDTNITMLTIPSWHHMLKSKFLLGKRNRRLDHLLYVLIKRVVAYYGLKQERQNLGFEGPDIELKKHKDIAKRA